MKLSKQEQQYYTNYFKDLNDDQFDYFIHTNYTNYPLIYTLIKQDIINDENYILGYVLDYYLTHDVPYTIRYKMLKLLIDKDVAIYSQYDNIVDEYLKSNDYNYDIIQLLIDNVQVSSFKYSDALKYAINHGDIRLIKMLLKKG